jgi:hypothetical protein
MKILQGVCAVEAFGSDPSASVTIPGVNTSGSNSGSLCPGAYSA